MDNNGPTTVTQSPRALIGICNPDVYNIRIFNPIIALQMLIGVFY